MNLLVNSNRCIKLPILRAKDLYSLMVGFTSTKFICPRHAKEYRLDNTWITSALSLVLSGPKLQFFFTWAHASDASLEVLKISHYVEEQSNIIVYHNNIQVIFLVLRCIEPLVVHHFDKVIRRYSS